MSEVVEVPASGLVKFLIENEPILLLSWKSFSRELGLDDNQILSMEELHRYDVDKQDLFLDIIKRWVSGKENATVLELISGLTKCRFKNATGRLRRRFGDRFTGTDYLSNFRITQANGPLMDGYRGPMKPLWVGFPLRELMIMPDYKYEIMELAESMRELSNDPINQVRAKVLITGSGQVGKSEMARNFAFHLHRCTPRYDCIWICGNGELEDRFNQFLTEFCEIQETEWRWKISALFKKFAGRKWLLIFDQIDHNSIPFLQRLVLEFRTHPDFYFPIIIVTGQLDNPRQTVHPSTHIEFVSLGQWLNMD